MVSPRIFEMSLSETSNLVGAGLRRLTTRSWRLRQMYLEYKREHGVPLSGKLKLGLGVLYFQH
jgi:hypothetical protein